MTLINKWQTTCYLLVTITLCMVAGDPNPDEKLEKEVDRKGKCEYPKYKLLKDLCNLIIPQQ